MSYLVLARKWRPKTFDDLAGQEPITRILTNAVTQGKISHAYIFSGPRGVGKTSTARILSKALNCKEGPTAHPCGICESCISITEGSSVDVIEIDGASNNSVDDIRDLRERVKYAPSGGKYKVYIIDEVHMLSGSAFNALLKTLEEPPSHVIFVLATTEMKKIPATVLSRCQHMPFRRISSGVIKARLKHIADTEGINISSHALGLVARAADGSMRDSLTILDQISSFTDEISEEQVQNLLGMTDFGMLSSASMALITGDRVTLLEIIDNLSEQGTDLRAFARELAQFFRDLLIASVVKQPSAVLDLNEEELTAITQLVAASSEDQLTLLLSEVMKAETDVRNSSLPRMALEMALIRASFLSSLKPVKEIIENLDRMSANRPVRTADPGPGAEKPELTPAGTESAPGATGGSGKKHMPPSEQTVAPRKPEPSADAADEEDAVTSPLSARDAGEEAPEDSDEIIPLSPDMDFSTVWHKVLSTIDAPLASKLEHAATELRGNVLQIILNGGQAVFQDTISRSLGSIEEKLAEHAGRKIGVSIIVRQKKTVRKKDLKETALNEPVIQEALELFEGRIVDVIPIENAETRENGGDDV
ncbi:MAG TPA: DNA polymerase III subunit gamma/tau [Thermodesulfovibrionales bacterium]|nr:DNA polymerase III subunit gamma/tau [Thermodesulfovibrionales bacterium]